MKRHKNNDKEQIFSRPKSKDLNKEENFESNVLELEEKQNRQLDDFRAHRHEKHREIKDDYRGGDVIESGLDLERHMPRLCKIQTPNYDEDILQEKKEHSKNN